MGESHSNPIPEWAHRERANDLTWIKENLHVFFPAAQQGFEQVGRGAIVTDTTTLVKHENGESNPFFYVTLASIEEQKWDDVVRLVRGYDPTWELVCLLLKQGRESSYRIGIPSMKK